MSNEDNGIVFQFHKGTIKTLDGVSFQNKIPNFNSIKVRLKQLHFLLEHAFFLISIP